MSLMMIIILIFPEDLILNESHYQYYNQMGPQKPNNPFHSNNSYRPPSPRIQNHSIAPKNNVPVEGAPPLPSYATPKYNHQSNPLPKTYLHSHTKQQNDPIPMSTSMMVARYKLANAYRYPANLEVALCHRQANRLGKQDIHEIIQGSDEAKDIQMERNRICPCCQNMMIFEEFPMKYNTYLKEVKEGGEKNELPLGISMYFTFIKMTIFFLLLRFFVFDLYTLYISSFGQYCANLYQAKSKDPCLLAFSAYNLKAAANQSQLDRIDFLSLIYIIITIIFFIIFRKILTKQKNLYIPFPFFKDSSFSILIQDIPPFIFDDETPRTQINYQYESQLQKILQEKIGEWLRYLDKNRNQRNLPKLDKDCIEQVINSTKYDIQDLQERSVAAVTICYDLTQLANIERMRQKLLKQYTEKDTTEQFRQQEENKKLLKYIPNQIKQLNKEYVRLCNHFVEEEAQFPGFKLTHFTGKAFISFQYEHYRDYFIRQSQEDQKFLKISGKPVKIGYANQPNDVSWENMKVTEEDRSSNVRYSWAVLIMLLILSFAAFFGLQMWQNYQQTQTFVGFGGQIYGFAISALQALVNFIINTTLAFSMNLLSVFERHKTKSDRLKALTAKVIVTQSLNTIFIYGFFYLFHPTNPLGSYGIVNKLFNVVLIGCFVNLLFTIIPIPSIWSWFATRMYTDAAQRINMFQIELNKKFQLPQFDFPTQYAFYIIEVYTISFYGYINPFATPIGIIFFYFQYWADKYNVLKRYSCPVDLSLQFTEMMVTAFELSVLFFAVGYFLWDTSIHYAAPAFDRFLNVLGIILSGLYVSIFLFTKEAFQNKILFNHSRPDLLSYSDYMSFKINKYAKTFFSENPSTALFRDIDTIANYVDASRKKIGDVHESVGFKRKFSYQPTFQKYIKEKIDEHFLEDNDIPPEPQLKKKQSSQVENIRNTLMSLWKMQEDKISQKKSKQGRLSHDPTRQPVFEVPEGDSSPKFNQFDLMYNEGTKSKEEP